MRSELRIEYCQNPCVVCVAMEGVATLFHPVTHEYLVLNLTGSDIWAMLERPKTLEHVVANLLDSYRVPQSRCLREVREWIEEALSRSLIIQVDAGGAA